MYRSIQFAVVVALLMVLQLTAYVLFSIVPAMVSAPDTLSVFMAAPVGLTVAVFSANIWLVSLQYLRKLETKIKDAKSNKQKGEVNAERN